ncbi:amidohydrolase family protein [Blastococcus sp. SYSU DS0539]
MTQQIVDVHTHIYPRLYLDRLAARTELPLVDRRPDGEYFVIFPGEAGRRLDETYWSLEEKLAYMDRSGITQSVVSLGNPWLDPFAPQEARELADELNAELATFAQRTGGRVVGMGCLPQGSVADAVAAVGRIQGTPGLHGVVSGTKLCGLAFDDPGLEPLWAALADGGTPLLVHPHHGIGLPEMDGFGHALPLALAFPFETTTALVRLAMSGVLDRHPYLRVIGSHGGGTLPYLSGRLDGCWAPDDEARGRRGQAPSTAFGRLYLDALVYHPRALRAAADLVGTGRMVFGTDHPFAIADPAVNIASIAQTFAEAESRAVLSRNAQEMFGLPALVEQPA